MKESAAQKPELENMLKPVCSESSIYPKHEWPH